MKRSLTLASSEGTMLVPTAAFLVSVIILAFCITALPAYGQVAGATLSGTITDPSGAVVLKATISIKNIGTGVVRDVTSNSSGFYTAPNLFPVPNKVNLTHSG